MRFKMNVCDFCCGLFSKCVDVCTLVECPYESNEDAFAEAENRFGLFLEELSEKIQGEMIEGNLQPDDAMGIEIEITQIEPKTYN